MLYDQRTLLRKCAQYLEIEGRDSFVKNGFAKGACFGLSVMYCMARSFLQRGIEIMADWDEQPESLDNQVNLSGMTINLRQLFEIFISLIIFHHQIAARFCDTISVADLGMQIDQRSFLRPEGSLECSRLQKEGTGYEIATIRNGLTIAGHFRKKDLGKILTKDLLPIFGAAKTTIICVVSNGPHICALRYERTSKHWFFYNSNYYEPMEREFSSAAEVVTEIMGQLGHSLNIRIATFDDQVLVCPTYDKLLLTHPKQILRGNGLHLMAHYRNDDHWRVLFNSAKNDKRVCIQLARALTKQDEDTCSGLQVMITHACTHLSNLFMLASRCKPVRVRLARALVMKDSKGWSGLQIMLMHARHHLVDLFLLASRFRSVRVRLAQAKDYVPMSHLLVRFAPDNFSTLCVSAAKDECIGTQLAKALVERNAQRETILHVMGWDSYEFRELFLLAEQCSLVRDNFAKALTIANDESWPAFHVMALLAKKESLLCLAELAKKHLSVRAQLVKALNMCTGKENKSGLAILRERSDAAECVSSFTEFAKEKSDPKGKSKLFASNHSAFFSSGDAAQVALYAPSCCY